MLAGVFPELCVSIITLSLLLQTLLFLQFIKEGTAVESGVFKMIPPSAMYSRVASHFSLTVGSSLPVWVEYPLCSSNQFCSLWEIVHRDT